MDDKVPYKKIKPAVLEDLFGHDVEAINKYLDLAKGALEKHKMGLKQGKTSKELEAITYHAHGLKSVAKHIGADNLAFLVEELESVSAEGDEDALSLALLVLEQLDFVEDDLTSYKENLEE